MARCRSRYVGAAGHPGDPGRWGGPRGSSGIGEPERYFGNGEHLLYTCRRHPVVLEPSVVVWFVSGALLVVALVDFGDSPVLVIAFAGFVAGSGWFASRFWQWWTQRYVLTNVRVLLLEGVLSRRVRGVPLRLVIDTSYHRTLGGRLLGYGDLELNLSGQPGLRTLTMLPRPDVMYRWIISLVGEGGALPPGSPASLGPLGPSA